MGIGRMTCPRGQAAQGNDSCGGAVLRMVAHSEVGSAGSPMV